MRASPRRRRSARFSALVPSPVRIERLWTGGAWLEGPVWLPEGALLFSDIPNDRVLRWEPATGVLVDTQPAGFANGHALDRDGSVVRCEHGTRSVRRVSPDGSVRTIVDAFDGKRLNSPNDVVVRSDGTIWFTDPPYGIISDDEGHRAGSELSGNFVFRHDPADGTTTLVTDALQDPNGLAFSPDESVLYVSDTSAARAGGAGNHHIMAFDVVDGRALARPRVFATIDDGVPDGFCADVQGNVFTSSAAGVVVLSPAGEELGLVEVPEEVSNCTFGGRAGRRLFITAASSLYAVDVGTTGAAAARA